MLEAANLDSSSLIDLIDVDDVLESLAPVDNHYQEPVENTEEVSENLDVPNQHPHYTRDGSVNTWQTILAGQCWSQVRAQ